MRAFLKLLRLLALAGVIVGCASTGPASRAESTEPGALATAAPIPTATGTPLAASSTPGLLDGVDLEFINPATARRLVAVALADRWTTEQIASGRTRLIAVTGYDEHMDPKEPALTSVIWVNYSTLTAFAVYFDPKTETISSRAGDVALPETSRGEAATAAQIALSDPRVRAIGDGWIVSHTTGGSCRGRCIAVFLTNSDRTVLWLLIVVDVATANVVEVRWLDESGASS